MKRREMGKWGVRAVFAVCLVAAATAGQAQEICRGDLDGDGRVARPDLERLLPLVFTRVEELDSLVAMLADVNNDGRVNAADVVSIVELQGFGCTGPTPTRANTSTPTLTPSPRPGTPTATPTFTRTVRVPTPTPTRTPSRTPITPQPTRTPRPTATPTPACAIQNGRLGETLGELTTSDCQRTVGDRPRFADLYSISSAVGTAIKVEVVGTASVGRITPYLTVIDPNGQFDRIEVAPPVEFTVTTTRPYLILVTSSPGTQIQEGPYRMTLTSRTCPAAVAISAGAFRFANLDGGECPDPVAPNTGTQLNLADIYTFSVPSALTNVAITMRQQVAESDMDPVFSVIGPGGFEIVSGDQTDDAASGGFGSDAQARFLTYETGTYTIIASGGGCDPAVPLETCSYTLELNFPTCTRTALTLPADSLVTREGSLYGDRTRSPCGAPLPIPSVSDDVPDTNSVSNLFTFTAVAGDVISIEMESEDDGHLFLFGPATAGNPLVARDDDSGSFASTANSQLAATLAVAGTYTIVAANNTFLLPPELPDDPIGDIVNYRLLLQRCPVRAALIPSAGTTLSHQFSTLDCVGFGDLPFRTYAFVGTAGQFVTALVSADDVDPFVRIIAPDGSQVANDNDLFNPLELDARANRLLPADGTYFIEVSTSPEQGAVDLTLVPPFTVQATACTPRSVTPGSIAASFDPGDCDLGGGRKYDVYSFSGPAGANPQPRVASVLPPSSGCVVALLAEGPQTPGEGCANDLTEFPLNSGGLYGFAIAANEPTVRGAYTVALRNCSLPVVGYGETRTGSLTGSSCADARGAGADWYLLRAPRGLVLFNDGLSGDVGASFPLAGVLTDTLGSLAVFGPFSADFSVMFPLNGNLGAMLKIAGASASDRGDYTLLVDPAFMRY